VDVRSLGYRTDIALLCYGGSELEDRGDHLVVRSPHNPTHWWGNFLLLREAPGPDEAGAWLERFAAVFPEAKHVALGFDDTTAAVGEIGSFAEFGLSCRAQRVMTARSVHEPAHRNSEAVSRELGSDDDWEQSIELKMRCKEDFHEPASFRRYATASVATNRRLVETGHGQWFGAFLGGRLVSQMGLFRAGASLARFQSVETDPEYRRLGLAGGLVHHAGRYGFEELGADTLVMVADPDYFAVDLYKAVGFSATETQLQAERAPVDA
jgi:ribosomal protein S18 acetylase RimI-like enzyme